MVPRLSMTKQIIICRKFSQQSPPFEVHSKCQLLCSPPLVLTVTSPDLSQLLAAPSSSPLCWPRFLPDSSPMMAGAGRRLTILSQLREKGMWGPAISSRRSALPSKDPGGTPYPCVTMAAFLLLLFFFIASKTTVY